jgi:tetratricopeptide (TPR) repeat protein
MLARFFLGDHRTTVLNRIFVSRDKELQQLDDRLRLMTKGQGQVCFVTGEAGFGKTTLAAEFAQRAQERDEELLVVIGDCNAQTGIGDPYLPFREVLAMLAGDIDDRVAQGMTTEENASRLKKFLRVSKRLIVDVGPDLIDIFLPGAGIATRAGALVVGDKQKGTGRSSSFSGSAAVLSMADTSLSNEQSRIFEQVTTVLTSLSQQKPLLVILDDLQWVDDSSASLLFHLARRIEGSRILIIGTYRPEEVAVGRGESRHPIAQVTTELKRHYGDPIVALGDETETETKQFVDSLIDTESNKLGDEFRDELHERTNGHALFTAELLLDMQERGDLLKDDEGDWTVGPSLDWNSLPARVEGVVEERISRLQSDLQEILTIASVEGETFTAQVIGRLQEIAERRLLKQLTQELDRQHRLVSEESSKRIGDTRISRFRFRHHMFQKYLYENLGESEREQLHEDVASILEALYEGRRRRISVQLAHHYEHAQMFSQAASYYLLAAERAASVHAYNEVLALADRGLDSLNRLGDVSSQSDLLLDLNLMRGEAQHHIGQFGESMETYRQTAELAAKLENPDALARAALGYDEPRWRCNLLETTAVELLNQALELLDDGDSALRVCLIAHLARASLGSASPDDLMVMLDDAIAMARRVGDPRALVESLRTRLNLDRNPAGIRNRVMLIDEILDTADDIGDKYLQMELHAYRAYDLVALGDTDGWARDLEELRQISVDISEPFYEYNHATMIVAPAIQAGRFEEAESLTMAAFETGQKLGVDNNEGVMGIQMFTIRREQGRLAEIAPIVKHFVDDHGPGAAWRPGLALVYADVGENEKARIEFERLADDRFSAIPRDSLWQTCLTYLSEVCCALDAREDAQYLYELLLPYEELTVVVGNASVCLGATSRFLGQLATVLGRWDDAARHFEHALELNARMSAPTWLAHTQYHFSRLLTLRGETEDVELAAELLDSALRISVDLGMRGLESRIKSGTGDG